MEPGELLAQGMEFARKGDQKQARELIAKAVKADPFLKQGWWALAHLLDDKDRQLHCLKQVLKLDPPNEEARAKLAELQGAHLPGEPAPHVPPPSDSQEPPSPRVSRGRNRYIFIAVAVVVVILMGALLTWLVASGALQGLFGGGQGELANLPAPTLPAAWTPTPEIMVLVPTGSPTATVTEVRPQNSPTITKTLPPSNTPRPLHTATITPTFNPRPVATMTPASPEVCPALASAGSLQLTEPDDDLYASAEEVLAYLNAGGSVEEVRRTLDDLSFNTEMLTVDLTNDGVSEIVIYSFAVYVFRCHEGQYEEMLRIQPEIRDTYGMSMKILTQDLIKSGVQNLIITTDDEGMGNYNYALNVLVFEWNGEEFTNLAPEEVHHPFAQLGQVMYVGGYHIPMFRGEMELRDIDRNGTVEIILTGAGTGSQRVSFWTDSYRQEIHTWMWNGEDFVLYDVSLSPAIIKLHAVQDGDFAALQSNYSDALNSYWRAINDTSLQAWNADILVWTHQDSYPGNPNPFPPPDPEQAKRVEAYARFRIIVTNYLLGRVEQAEAQYQIIQNIHPAGDPGLPYAQMATAFYDAYQDFAGSIRIGCNAAQAYAIHNESKILVPLGWSVYGEVNIAYDAEDICPFQ
jgi:tetratricopeptide (TPR) repeat protein